MSGAVDVLLFEIGVLHVLLGGDGDVFADGHRQGAGEEGGEGGDQDLALRVGLIGRHAHLNRSIRRGKNR